MTQPLRQDQSAALAGHITAALAAIDAKPSEVTVVPAARGLIITATIYGRQGTVIIPPGWTADYAEVARLLKSEASTLILVPSTNQHFH